MALNRAGPVTVVKVEDLLPVTDVLPESSELLIVSSERQKGNRDSTGAPLKVIVPERSTSNMFMSILIVSRSNSGGRG
jgi:hypothetical protein